jgi:TRAP-type C4-dicarboxylate transport system permease small subunit
MLGAPLALRQRAHVGFELMLRYLPASMGSVVYVVAQILIFAFLVTMFWSGYRGLASALRQTDAALQISLFWVMLSIPVGFFLMAYTQLALIAEKFFNSQTKERV